MIPNHPKMNKNSKLPINFKIILFIYLFLSALSFFYLFADFKRIYVPNLFQLWLSLAYGYWVCFSFILSQIGLGSTTLRLPIFRNCELSGFPFLIFSFGAGFYISNCILTFLAIFKWMNGFGTFLYFFLK